ncbi:M20/M25/M40 family metallo-hydrolase [Bacillus sp. NEB1478]|uniref:M20/M25/M40 family metallo-hydrolase n=1 Tax=Bacillus sp. NEB1478 TaxID=3073816 RepID=UPI002873671F|nr:M20/M25/M40 family metallo-hydrolase [Bacillus sp. NEB1478]WNB92882.1 M20/M25/M40 family metallo-hydrolase [Bacillus sp. NEB1478]
MFKWQTKEGYTNLVKDLVSIPSITHQNGEMLMAEHLYHILSSLDYFTEHPEHVRHHPTPDGRKLVTAFVQNDPSVKETIILLSHFDVVPVEDFGEWKHLAFRPDELTEKINANIDLLHPFVQEDIKNGEWLFGRGTMDMKAGVALHLSMIEKAATGHFKGNVLMISVPDEEVHSAGMLAGVSVLRQLQEEYGIHYITCLNGEPSFTKYPGDTSHYMYTGSTGKILPGFLCFGKETHVGEPFAGLNANAMVAEITQELEWNINYCEKFGDEATPVPTNLIQKDLKDHYSVQIPHAAVTLFNIMMFNRPLAEITDMLFKSAQQAANRLEDHLYKRSQSFSKIVPFTPKKEKINVITFNELYEHAVEKYGQEELDRRENMLQSSNPNADERELTIQYVYELASICKDLAPMTVLFYTPPFYPAVCSSDHPLIQMTTDQVIDHTKNHFKNNVNQVHYFSGLSDLSYVCFKGEAQDLSSFTANFPLLGSRYHVPFEDMRALDVPVLNIGPMGKDAHQWTERLEINRTIEETHPLIIFAMESLFENYKKLAQE